MREVHTAPNDAGRFGAVVDPASHEAFQSELERGATALRDRTVWHLNSTAQGGGVAEMLRTLLGYLAGAGIRTRWLVIDGDSSFFDMTKRLHHLLHGAEPRDGSLTQTDRTVYERTLRAEVTDMDGAVAPDDIVVLHDPQTLGMAPALAEAGARVVWVCHVGVDEPNELARAAWAFLRPYTDLVEAHVFSRRGYAWDGLDDDTIHVVPPCIDPFSAKNREMDPAEVTAVLRRTRIEQDLPAGVPLVAQVSRWDALKDPAGLIRVFDRQELSATRAHLVLAGPAEDAVADDPEAAEVLADVRWTHRNLPESSRRRIHVLSLPMDDVDENALVVNALQRRSDVIVQKSLAEGFGLTVAEAMWKARPVVGSRVGGIQDQIVNGESGLLIDDPNDLASFGSAIAELLAERRIAARMGERARDRVTREYLPPRYLSRFLEVVGRGGHGVDRRAS